MCAFFCYTKITSLTPPVETFSVSTESLEFPITILDAQRAVASQMHLHLDGATDEELDSINVFLARRLYEKTHNGAFSDQTGKRLDGQDRMAAVTNLAQVLSLPKLNVDIASTIVRNLGEIMQRSDVEPQVPGAARTDLADISIALAGKLGKQEAINPESVRIMDEFSLKKLAEDLMLEFNSAQPSRRIEEPILSSK